MDIKKHSGTPDLSRVSASYVERQSLTLRMGIRRFTRLTNGFSKKVENLSHVVSLHYMHHNFGRVHQTLTLDGAKRTLAMAAGVADHPWSTAQIAVCSTEWGPRFLSLLSRRLGAHESALLWRQPSGAS